MNKYMIFLILTAGFLGCYQQPTIERDGGTIVTISYPVYKSGVKKDLEIIKKRIDHEGLTLQQITIDSINSTATLSIPKTSDTTLLRALITQKGMISLLTSYENGEIIESLKKINESLRKIVRDSIAKQPKMFEKKDVTLADLLKKSQANESFEKMVENPLFSLLIPAISHDSQPIRGAIIGFSKAKDTAKIMQYLNMKENKALYPKSLEFLWGLKSQDKDSIVELFAIKKDGTGYENISSNLVSCGISQSMNNIMYEINFTLDEEGAGKFAQLTRFNIGRCIPIIMDNKVISAPVVNSIIEKGNAVITGRFNEEEARTLSGYLRSGGLSGTLTITKFQLIKKK